MWQLMQTFHPLWTRFAGLSHERAAKMKTDNGNDVLGKWKSLQSFNKISSYFLSVYTKFYISLQGIKTLLSTFSFFVYFVLLENVRRRIRWFFHFPKNVSLSWRICLLSRPLLELRPHHQTLTCQKKINYENRGVDGRDGYQLLLQYLLPRAKIQFNFF